MTSKRNRRKPRHSATSPGNSPAELLAQANGAVERGDFRTAIDRFKALSKSEPATVWEQGLAAAYRGRALALEAKGMDKEALTIWDNRSRICPDLPPDPRHLALLLRLGQIAPALTGYRRLLKGDEPAAAESLRRRFAALYLAGCEGLEQLPPEDPVVRDGATAAAALAAYCAGDDSAMGGHLKRIPFRSPYRDFATLLKALTSLPGDPAGARRLLERVADDSPFAPLARAAQLAMRPEEELLASLAAAGEPTRRFTQDLLGWPQERRRLWQELHRLGDPPGTGPLMALLKRHRSRLGDGWVRRQAMALVHADFPRKPPPAALAELGERERIIGMARTQEEDQDPWDTFETWKEAIDRIAAGRPAPGSDDALRIALIQRRLARDLDLLDSPMQEEVEQELLHSLELDPEYLPGHLLLIGHYRGNRRLKEARRVLERALARWPEAVDLLQEALETALAGDAFKKAAGMARRILKQDPINRRARQSLFRAHLAHARKQVPKGRGDLARKELEQAAQWADGPLGQARLDLLRGLVELLSKAPARELLLQACRRLGDGITGRFALALEAERLGLSPEKVLQQAGLHPVPQPDRDDLMGFCRAVREVLDGSGEEPDTSWKPFREVVMRATGLELPQQDCETLCETLRMAWQPELRLAHARAALKRWPGRPVFVLHAFEAGFSSRFTAWPPEVELERLEEALELAREEGDNRTAHRLVEALNHFTGGPLPYGGFAEPDSDELDVEDEVFPGVPLGELDPELLLDLMRDTIGPEFREMERRLGREGMLRAVQEMMESGKLPPLLSDADNESPAPRRRKAPRRSSHDQEDPEDPQLELF